MFRKCIIAIRTTEFLQTDSNKFYGYFINDVSNVFSNHFKVRYVLYARFRKAILRFGLSNYWWRSTCSFDYKSDL